MKLVPIDIFSFFSCSSLAQNCTIIDGLAVNCLDQHNRKQGYWKEIQKELISTVHSGYGSVDGCQRKDVFNFYLLADGNFLNDKKTGVWNYYVLWTKLEDKFKIVEKEIHYLPTGE